MAESSKKAKKKRSRKSKEHSATNDTDEPLHKRNKTSSQQQQHQQHQQSLLIKIPDEGGASWYDIADEVPGRNATILTDPLPTHHIKGAAPNNVKQQPQSLVDKYRRMADELFRNEIQLFGRQHGQDRKGDLAWIQSTISRGTLKDRIAAMSVVVSTHPVHKFHALDGLLQMAGCSSDHGNNSNLNNSQTNSRVAQLAGEALMDLFTNTFLPQDRKLLTLAQRPLHLYEQQQQKQQQTQEEADTSNDKKKKKDKSKNQQQTTRRTLSPRVLLLWRFEEMVKDKYQSFLRQYVGYTLREGTEQQKIATLRLASNLLQQVPEGEAIVLPMICNKLGDPLKKVAAGAGHALRQVLHQHPAMQTVVAREVQQLAHRPQLSPRALYNCITFLNQLKFRHQILDENEQSLPASLISTYFRLFEVTVQKATGDKDASSMKGRLLSALLAGVNRAHPYLPEKDQEMEEHVDALYRVVYKAPPGACTQALLLLFHMAVGSKLGDEGSDHVEMKVLSEEEVSRQERFYQTLYSRCSHAEMLRSGKHLTMFFNLLYKAMKYDRQPTRVIAYAKQLLSTTMHCSPPVSAASVFLLNEVAKSHKELAQCFDSKLEEPDASRILNFKTQVPQEALVLASEAGDKEKQQTKADNTGKKRISQETKLAPLWEISMLLKHHHPSVSNFALNMGKIEYPGDPLKDFALAPFLDKFAYRNPKSSERTGKSTAKKSVAARHNDSLAERKHALPLNDPSFVDQKNVDVQDEFFHLFFVERAKREKMKDGKPETVQVEDDAKEKVETDAFDAYEQAWGTDEEEEAYVDELAQKIIEDSIEESGFGPGDLDDEDPDMTGWDDLRDDDEEDINEEDENQFEEDSEEDPHYNPQVYEGESSDSMDDFDLEQADDNDALDDNDDDDAFMEGAGDSSDSNDDDEELEGEASYGNFLDDEEEEDMDDEDGQYAVDKETNDEALNDLALIGDESSDEEQSNHVPSREEKKAQKTKSKKKKKNESLYASLDDYQEKIDQAWYEMTRPKTDAAATDEKPSSAKKKTKTKKKKT